MAQHTIKQALKSALPKAMKARNQIEVTTLRLALGAIKDREIAQRGTSKNQDIDEVSILRGLIKKRRESITLFEQGGRDELAQLERQEIIVLEAFLPAQMDAEATRQAVQKAIQQVGAKDISDMGKVMGKLKADYPDTIDLSLVGPCAKAALSR